jgi:hypothetical protein
LLTDANGIITEPDSQYYIDFDNIETCYESSPDSYGFYLPKGWSVVTSISGLTEETFPVSSLYKGNRYGYTQQSVFHKGLNRYVQLWKDDSGKEVYRYDKTEYVAPILVTNYITNSKNFSSTDGWYPNSRASGLTIEKVCGRFFGNFKPIEEEVFNAGSASINRDFYIRVAAPDNTSGTLYGFYNTGFTDNRLSIEINANDRIALRGYVYNDYG